MPKLSICIDNQEQCFNVSMNVLLSDFFRQAGIGLAMPCSGNHTCGKCIVRVSENPNGLSLPSDDEKNLLGKQKLLNGNRLACFARVVEDCKIIADSYKTEDYSIQTGFFSAPSDSLSASAGFDIASSYGISVDIGTTTIASYLYSLNDCKLLSTVGEMNNQAAYGADVVSRIDYSNHDEACKLHTSIKNQLSEIFIKNLEQASLKQGNSITLSDITKLVITGNTTMLHFLMNYPASGIAVSPFTPHSLFGFSIPASDIFKQLIRTQLYLPPCVGAYVGADAVCAVLASDMTTKNDGKTYLMADIGTNGEMALYHKGKLYTCSTAAGPAFEGAGIQKGMTARAGAVTDIAVDNDIVQCVTIGNAPPVGICGTGLINCLAKMLELNALDESGAINDEENPFVGYDENLDCIIKLGADDVYITQKDVRQIQLAKAAIHAGILTLCHECGISVEEISTLFLCGGFGSVIDPYNAAKIGLIPSELSSRVIALGNAAGLGASMILCSDEKLSAAVNIANTAIDIPLSSSGFFMEKYVDCMMF